MNQNTNLNIFDLPVHPSANLFPMISNDDLKEMADDISLNGLIHPVVVSDGVLIDGRNRREACRIAKIEPEYKEFSGNINAFINSANNIRRELTKGQKAMSYAVMFPVGIKGKTEKLTESTSKPSKDLLSRARKILQFTPDAQADVLSANVGLNKAYENACIEEEEALNRIKDAEERASNMASMQNDNADLYELVIEERMSFDEAQELVLSRNSEEIEKHTAMVNGVNMLLKDLLFNAQSFETDVAIERNIDNIKSIGGEFDHHTVNDVDEAMKLISVYSENLNKFIKGFYNE